MKKKYIKSFIIVILIFSVFMHLNMKSHEVLSRKSISVVDEIKSPNNEYKSVIFLDGGSATVSNNIRVAVVKNSKKRIYDSDIVFLQSRVNYSRVKWDSNNELVISYYDRGSDSIIKQIDSSNGINIIYKKIEEDF